MIRDIDNNKSYLATGGSDNFISIFDISKECLKDLNICNNIIEKMSHL